jgi:hypothetical protein
VALGGAGHLTARYVNLGAFRKDQPRMS